MPLSSSVRSRLEFQHRTIRELIGGRTEQQLQQRSDPAKWSIFENIAHLACYQPVFLRRLETIQREESPVFGRYSAEMDPEFPGYCQRPLAWLLDSIDERRAVLFHKLAGMNEDQLSRTGHHPRYGELSIIQWTEFFLLHEAHHIYTIFSLRFVIFTNY